MRRFLLGFLIALAVSVPATLAAAPSKVVNVTSPMSADLDAANHDIVNVKALEVSDIVHANGIQIGGTVALNDAPRILQSWVDPTVGSFGHCPMAAPGTLLLRHPDDAHSAVPGELWLKRSAADCDWLRVAG